MTICPQCGKENATSALICEHCHAPLATGGAPPRLLAGIQGLIPAEPIISTGRLREEEPLAPPAEPVAATPAVAGDEAEAREKEEDREPAPAVEPEVPEVVETTPAAPEPPSAPPRGRHPVWIPAFEAEPEPEPEVAVTAAAVEPVGAFPIVLARPAAIVLHRPPASLRLRWIFALALVGVIALAQFFSVDDAASAPRRPAVETAYTAIELLPDRSRVLLAWDYDPTTQGEMHLLAQPIIRHLRLKRARIANVSLRPLGPAVAAEAMALADAQLPLSVQAAQPPVVQLGFIPGDAAALRSLSQSPVASASLPAFRAQELGMAADETVEAFDLIIEFSAETAASREWIEQIASRQRTPVIIAASGAVAPTLRPYEQTGQIAALLSGYPDALAYEQMLGAGGPASAQQSAQTWLNLLFAGLIVVLVVRSIRRGDRPLTPDL